MEPGKVRKDRAPHGDPGWRSCLCPQSNLWVGIRKLSVRCWEQGYRVEVYVPAWDRKAASGRASGLPVQAGSRCGSARTSSAESCGSKVRARRVSKPECYRCEDRIMLSILRDSGFTSPWGMRILPNGSAYGGMGLPMPEREFRGRCYRPHSAEMLLWFLSTGEVPKPRVQPSGSLRPIRGVPGNEARHRAGTVKTDRSRGQPLRLGPGVTPGVFYTQFRQQTIVWVI